MPLSQMSDAFMEIYRSGEPVVRDVDDTLAELHVEVRRQARMAGETARPTAVVDVPFTYGTLSLNTLNPDGFSETDVSLVKELARVIDLGYARYLDLRALQRDRAVEHIRGGIQAMERAADFEEVLSSVADDVKAMGLTFDTCGIDVLDEPVEDPTMAYFEERGFRYINYTIDPDGDVARQSHNVQAPFPRVNLEMIQRFIEGKPWTGRSGDTSIVEVPFAGYGRLTLTSTGREDFGEDDIETLEEFAAAIALGYTRYLDFQELEAKNTRLEELDAAKTDFLSGVAHELRTPMTAIRGYIDNLLDGIAGQVAEGQANYLSRIRSNADRLTRMVGDLLDLSRIDRGRADLIDLNVGKLPIHEVVQTTVEDLRPLADEKNLALTVEADEAHAMADRDRLTQVVTNLVGNAIKFTETGEVTVTVRSDGQGSVRTAVGDTGRGIPAEDLERVFERLYQVREEGEARQGSGLGLAISKEFVELMGGKIWVESEVGRGSRITFTVPEASS
jgi:signal transduction histidine kinase